MKRDHFKLISAGIAIGVYLLVTSTVLYYFNYRSSSKKSVHYVKKNSDIISVSLAGTRSLSSKKEGKKKQSRKTPKKKPQKVRNISSPKHREHENKPAKKPAKKIQARKLFSSVKTSHKASKNSTHKARKNTTQSVSHRATDTLKKSQVDNKGRENRYFASVEEKLRGWPAQANYAGETISIWLKVYPSGSFEFKVKKRSANSEFNEALIAYLKQLQDIGLGRHNNSRPYEIEVAFEAVE